MSKPLQNTCSCSYNTYWFYKNHKTCFWTSVSVSSLWMASCCLSFPLARNVAGGVSQVFSEVVVIVVFLKRAAFCLKSCLVHWQIFFSLSTIGASACTVLATLGAQVYVDFGNVARIWRLWWVFVLFQIASRVHGPRWKPSIARTAAYRWYPVLTVARRAVNCSNTDTRNGKAVWIICTMASKLLVTSCVFNFAASFFILVSYLGHWVTRIFNSLVLLDNCASNISFWK